MYEVSCHCVSTSTNFVCFGHSWNQVNTFEYYGIGDYILMYCRFMLSSSNVERLLDCLTVSYLLNLELLEVDCMHSICKL